MPQTSKYFLPLFWLAATLVQVGDIRLYGASLQLLEVILKTLDYTECFKDLVRGPSPLSHCDCVSVACGAACFRNTKPTVSGVCWYTPVLPGSLTVSRRSCRSS